MGYRRIRQVTNWVLVPEETPSEVLLKNRFDKPTPESEVEGVVYSIASTAEAYRLEKHAQAEYGAGSYATVAVEIEILAHGTRRSRNISGQTIVYTGGGVCVNEESNDKPAASKNHAMKIQRSKELARKPLPFRPHSRLLNLQKPLPRSPSLDSALGFEQSAQKSFDESLPRSPSLHIATVAPRPVTYRGASLRGTQSMISERGVDLNTTSDEIIQSLNAEISMAYNDWKGVSKVIGCPSERQEALMAPSSQNEKSSQKEVLTRHPPTQELLPEPTTFGQRKYHEWSKHQMTQDTVRGYLASQGFQHFQQVAEDYHTHTKPDTSSNSMSCESGKILPALAEQLMAEKHNATFDGEMSMGPGVPLSEPRSRPYGSTKSIKNGTSE